MQYHGRYGSFSVRAGHHYAFFVFGFVVHEFGIRVNGNVQFPRARQFRVVTACVHTEYHGVQFGGYLFGKPAFFGWRQYTGFEQARARRFVYHVVRTGNRMAFALGA